MVVRNWLKFIILSASSCALSVGCTRKVEQATQVRIAFPPAQSVMMQSVSSYVAGSVWQGSAPSTGSDVNCYMVAVSSTDGLNGSNRCFRLDNTNVFATSMLHGAFPAGTTQEITVKSGSSRTVYLIGLRASNINECKLIGGTVSGLDTASLSAPIILASQTLDLTSGAATSINFTVPNSLSNTTTFENCAPMSLYVPSSVPAFSVSSVSPPYGPIAGGTSITLTGVGFTAGTTFTIGGTACTSTTYVSSTQMTCVTPTLSAGARNVVATRPSDSQTATLTNGFNAYSSATVSVADISVYEYDPSAVVTVTLSASMPMNTTVNYTTNASSASAGSDFTTSTGSVTIVAGTTSATITVPIINDGVTESSEMFDVQISLPGGSPLILGIAYSDITITDDDVATGILTISDGPTFNYPGTIYNGGTSDKTFTVTNSGTGPANTMAGGITGEFTYKGSSYPGTGGDCGGSLAASTSCTIVVSFVPVGPSTRTGSIDITYHNGVSPQTASRAVQGPGVAVGVLNISGGPTYDYGTIAVGASIDMTFTLSNGGGTTLNAVSSAALNPPFAYKGTGTFPGTGGDCSTPILSACTIVVTFTPTVAGVHSDTIEINYNAGLGAVSSTRDITGTGANPASLTISDGSSYNYGNWRVGETLDKQFTLTNSGGLTASAVAGGGFSAPYSFKGGTFPGTGGDCGATLAPSATCTFVVSFAPTVAGNSGTTVSVSYFDGSSAQAATRPVTGTGYMNIFYVTTTGSGAVEKFKMNSNNTISMFGTSTPTSPDGNSPNHIIVSPNNAYVYVSTDDTSNLKRFSIDNTGGLTSLGVNSFGSVPSPLMFDRLSRWLMFGTAGSGGIEVMDWNSSSGAVASVVNSPFSAANQIGTPVFHPTLDVVFLTGRSTGATKSFTVDGSGQMTLESTSWTTTYPTSVAVHNNGTWVYVSSEDGYSVERYNYTAGSPGSLGSMIFTIGTQDTPKKLLFHPTLPNVLYALSSNPGTGSYINVYAVDGVGDLTHATTYENLNSTNITDMIISSSGSFLLVTDCANSRVRMYSISGGNGSLTLVNDYPTVGSCATGISEAYINN